jgi:hypothetical protein
MQKQELLTLSRDKHCANETSFVTVARGSACKLLSWGDPPPLEEKAKNAKESLLGTKPYAVGCTMNAAIHLMNLIEWYKFAVLDLEQRLGFLNQDLPIWQPQYVTPILSL